MDPFQRAVLENQIVIMNTLASNAAITLQDDLDERIRVTKLLIEYTN